MEFDNLSSVQKYDIKLKTKPKDGIILQLHHTLRGSHGQIKRIRFSIGTFEDIQDKLACADNVGNIFILDFTDLKFWKLSNQGPCSALQFVPHALDTLIVANTKKNEMNFIDSGTGQHQLTLPGHTAPIKFISFSSQKSNILLSASSVEAILWELKNYTKYFTLNTFLTAQIQQISFTPTGEYLVACFQNDTIQIWRNETMKSVKQIIPKELKHLKSFAFTSNGRALAIVGLTPILILFSMDTWKSLRSIDLHKYNISGVQQAAFIPQMFDGGSNKIIALLSSDCILYFLDLGTLKILHTIHPDSSGIRKFVVSATGKYFLCILQQGEVNIYNTSHILDMIQSPIQSLKKDLPCTSTICKGSDSPKRLEIEEKMRKCMDSARLRRILMQYGEYPDKFRSIIWRSLLATPRNKSAYSALLDKGIHPSYKDIEKCFTIHSSITLKSLKRLLSCLAHWCPLFGVMKFLPSFVFPFVKVLQKDPLLLFECVATILLNQCQLWFEYAPFPPISVLAIIENILAEHDPHLLDHYCNLGVTSQIYALKILETAFSEVLTCSEWLILWDHVLSNEPAFILMAIVAYNMVQKNSLRKLSSQEQIEKYFHMQNPINKKIFLKKAYSLLNDTPEDIHPRRFLKSFVALDKGSCYQLFTGYPKATICLKLARKDQKHGHKKEKYTLKELTTKCQEEEIDRRKNGENCSDADYSSNSEKDLKNCGSAIINNDTTRKSTKHRNRGDSSKKAVKDDLIEIIMGAAAASNTNKGKKIYKGVKVENDEKSKRQSEDTNTLEREIEKLIHNCSVSSESED